jgi:PAP2 superfamily protein
MRLNAQLGYPTKPESEVVANGTHPNCSCASNLAFADSVIAFYDAKYTYNLWRPVTAIRAGDVDESPDTVGDPNWLPEVGNTTPDPSYPGAHAVISAAAETVLVSFFHKRRFNFNVTSEVLPGVERSFTSFAAADEEATQSRIFAGVHFRFDLTTGQILGREVADFVLDNFLTATNRSDKSEENQATARIVKHVPQPTH